MIAQSVMSFYEAMWQHVVLAGQNGAGGLCEEQKSINFGGG